MKRNLTDEQFVTLARHFIGGCQPITSILQEFAIPADTASVEMELWVGGFKQCPRCSTWHDDLWHNHCPSCQRRSGREGGSEAV
ncbi:MAG: hypothetical protein KJ063_24795 [Anaerolineae bacterium]|nr:hypothetical protein [Anaerolineae bacterium]